MRATDPTDGTPDAGADVVLVVRVVRTGGFAGLRREWTAEPDPHDAPKWIGLIDECPWEAAASASPPRGADLFQWRISARCADEPPRRAELADDQLEGPWRELVDEVRAFDRPENAAAHRDGGGGGR